MTLQRFVDVLDGKRFDDVFEFDGHQYQLPEDFRLAPSLENLDTTQRVQRALIAPLETLARCTHIEDSTFNIDRDVLFDSANSIVVGEEIEEILTSPQAATFVAAYVLWVHRSPIFRFEQVFVLLMARELSAGLRPSRSKPRN